MPDVLVQRVVVRETHLDRDELVTGITLVHEEEEARVELVGDGVDAVRERVPAAEQVRAAVVAGADNRMWASAGTTSFP